jgi:hypothetical protein
MSKEATDQLLLDAASHPVGNTIRQQQANAHHDDAG